MDGASTVAQSLTLAQALTGVVAVPARVVEPLIALPFAAVICEGRGAPRPRRRLLWWTVDRACG